MDRKKIGLATVAGTIVGGVVGVGLAGPVGGVIGVGLAKGVGHLNLASIGKIVTSWLITIPAGATLCILFYVILRLIFNV